jgi:hypothetical protein
MDAQTVEAWVMQAIMLASQGKPCKLPRILFCADMVMRAALAHDELEMAISRLLAQGLVKVSNDGFEPTDLAIKLAPQIGLYLGVVAWKGILQQAIVGPSNVPPWSISKAEFDAADREFRDMFR